MAQATLVAPVVENARRPVERPFQFQSLVVTEPTSAAKGRSATLSASLLLHAVLIVAIVLLPLLGEEILPAPEATLRAFFVSPSDVALPPPPPPPPAAGARSVRRAPAVPRPLEPTRLVAPVEIPADIQPDVGLDLGVEGGVPGGVEGGVPGGVVGGIVGGLPAEAPPPPPRVVRVGGHLVAPKVVRRVSPEYPLLARQARVAGIVILEAQVDVHGYVKTINVLRSNPLLDEAAVTAVKQWRYQPLLLNGEPTEFILTVTVQFDLQSMQAQ